MTPCPLCNRLDCPLLSTSIVGTRNYVEALINCMTAERKAKAPKQRRGETVAEQGRRR